MYSFCSLRLAEAERGRSKAERSFLVQLVGLLSVALLLISCFSPPRSEQQDAAQSQHTAALLVDRPVGPELDVDAAPKLSSAGHHEGPVIAEGPDGISLVVWQLNGSVPIATRIDAQGRALDPEGIILTYDSSVSWPRVAFNGENWLVVWNNGRSNDGVRAARITPAGELLDPLGLTISSSGFAPDVTAVGANWLIIWSDASRVLARYFNSDVQPLSPSELVLAEEQSYPPARVSAGNGAIVVWENGAPGLGYDIWACLLDEAGNAGAPFPIVKQAMDEMAPDIDFDGSNWYLVWEQIVEGAQPHLIYGSRISQAGVLLDAPGVLLGEGPTPSGAAEGYEYARPAVQYSGGRWLSVWSTGTAGTNDIGGRFISADGQPQAAPLVINEAVDLQRYPSLSTHGEAWQVVWADWRKTSDIYGAVVDETAQVAPPSEFRVTTPFADQYFPSVSWGNQRGLVTWYEANTPHFGLLEQDGTPLLSGNLDVLYDQGPWPSDSLPSPPDIYAPRAGFNGHHWLVVSHGNDAELFGTLVDHDGKIDAHFNITLGSSMGVDAHVSTLGDGWLITWQEADQIHAARVAAEGERLDANSFVIASGSLSHPTSCAGNEDVLVAWWKRDVDLAKIQAVRVASDGSLRDDSLIDVMPFTNAAQLNIDDVAQLAFNGRDWIVSWTENTATSTTIRASRIDQSGRLLDEAPHTIHTGSEITSTARLGAMGALTTVTWTESSVTHRGELWGVQLDRELNPLSTTPFPISRKLNHLYGHDVAADPLGNSLAVYDRYVYFHRVNSRLLSCSPSSATDATCDGIDDDCDGIIDDDYVETSISCGYDSCESIGSLACINGQELDNCHFDPHACTPVTPASGGSSSSEPSSGGAENGNAGGSAGAEIDAPERSSGGAADKNGSGGSADENIMSPSRPPRDQGGCGCAVHSTKNNSVWFLTCALLLLIRRRRRRAM